MRRSPAWLLGRLAVHLRNAFGSPPGRLADRLATYQRPEILRCSCGSPAADDELDICPTCRPRRDRAREEAEVAAHREDRLRTRRKAAQRRREAEREAKLEAQRAAEEAAKRPSWPPNVTPIDEPELSRPAPLSLQRRARG